MKMRILALTTVCVMLVIGTIIVSIALAAEPQAGPGFQLSGSSTSSDNAGKYPSISAFGHTVYIGADTDKQAQFWEFSDTTSTSPGAQKFGSTNGDTDFTQATIAPGPTGDLYAMWISQSSSIKLRRKPVGGNWGDVTTAINTGAFMSYLDIAVTKNGQIFAVWNQNSLYRYSFSSDGGNSWSSPTPVSSKQPYRSVAIAAGGDTVVIAFGGGDGHVYASVWNGSSFDTVDITPDKTKSDFFASARPAVGADNKVYVSFRNAPGGIFYSERKPDNTWPISKLANGASFGPAGMAVDEQNNVHFSWASDASGRYQAYYAFKPANGDWQGPIKVDGIDTKVAADVDVATTITTRALAHTVFETFDGGGGAQIRYQQFSGIGGPVGPAATPVLESGVPTTNHSTIALAFTGVTGNPDSVRTHWDGATTDADTWRTFTNPIAVPAPASVSTSACETHKLTVQLRTGTVAGQSADASLTFDFAVQAQVDVLNPHLMSLPTTFNLTTQAANPADNGAPDGDPTYSRERSVFLRINSFGQDCSNLALYQIPGSDSAAGTPITNNTFTGPAALPGTSAPGDKPVIVHVKDTINNEKVYSYTITYDPANTDTTGTSANTAGLPVLTATGSPTVTFDTNNSIIRTLTFNNISVNDNIYGQKEGLAAGKRFWGVYIANTTSPTIAANDASLKWIPVHVAAPNNTFSVTWDLFSGLSFTSDIKNKSGTYYIFVRFLDGAGNASTGFIKQKVTLTPGYSIPTQMLPQITR